MTEPLAHRLRTKRISRGLNLADLAKAVKLSVSFLSQIETGKRQPSEAAIRKLAEFYKEDADDLCAMAQRVPQDVLDILLEDPGWGAVIRHARKEGFTSNDAREAFGLFV